MYSQKVQSNLLPDFVELMYCEVAISLCRFMSRIGNIRLVVDSAAMTAGCVSIGEHLLQRRPGKQHTFVSVLRGVLLVTKMMHCTQ